MAGKRGAKRQHREVDGISEAAGPSKKTGAFAVHGDDAQALDASYALPTPTDLLSDCSAMKEAMEVTAPVAMSEADYMDALDEPTVCNLQLRVADVSTEELRKFPAKLPASDAFSASQVLRTRIKSWRKEVTPEGVSVFELQLGVEQQLLDSVVRALYTKQLEVCPETAEAMLLLADYLQMDWLTKAVAAYLKQRVIETHALAVCRLTQRFPSLDLFQAAIDSALAAAQPPQMVELAQLVPAASPHRRGLLRAVAGTCTPPERLQFLDLLLRTTEVRLDATETLALLGPNPELAIVMTQPPGEGRVASYEDLWARHYLLHREAALAPHQPSDRLVWDVPLGQVRASGQAVCRQLLHAPDGRRFRLRVSRPSGRGLEGAPMTWLWIQIMDRCEWQQEDAFRVCAVADMKDSRRPLMSTDYDFNQRSAFSMTLNKWFDAELGSDHTVARGEFLPIMVQLQSRNAGRAAPPLGWPPGAWAVPGYNG